MGILKIIKKNFILSVSSIIILSVLAIIYSLIKSGDFMRNIFNFNFLISSIIILYGLLGFFVPINLNKSNRLVDHSNYAEVHRDEKEKRLSGSLESILWGITNIVIVGIIEVIIKSF